MTDSNQILTEESEKRARQLFDMHRERSGAHPVVVELSVCTRPMILKEMQRKVDWEESRLTVLLSLAPRWETAILETSRATLDQFLLRLFVKDFPNIQEIKLSFKNDDHRH